MEIVKVNLKKKIDDSYGILIDRGLLKRLPKELKKSPLGNKYLIITDTNVKNVLGSRLLEDLRRAGFYADLITFKAGEQSKNINVFGNLLQKAQNLGLDRKSCIIALGGGVVGDIAGFVAATYMRGISYVQVPTTLLAMVDSSIGGKVAVDMPTGKNMVGAFFQPKKVFIDISLLKTLPKKEMLCGLAEIIKHALIADRKLFDFIKKNLKKILDKDESVLIKLIKRNCEIKAKIVGQDEKESGIRKIVNYGHTIGHAIETLTNYTKLSHGEAIAIGMAIVGKISVELGMLSEKELHMQNKLFNDAGLSIKLPNLDHKKILSELSKDKKAVSGKVEFVLLKKIGKAKFGIKVPNKIILKSLGG